MGWLLCLVALLVVPLSSWAADPHRTSLDPIPSARFRFGGELGRRIDANVEQWLVPAPASNPGMIQMFKARDQIPPPQIVPWAGEFAGKYLISAVQALRMSDEPRLQATLDSFVRRLLWYQDTDGYLGPFPRQERLLRNWDLWGHDHVMLGLLLWHERTGDKNALEACRQIARLVSKTYPEAQRSFFDAGSHEMNMAIAHGLGRLQLVSPDPKTLAALHAVEKDWKRAGDYLRTGLAGVDFYRTPRPRWESLGDLQALVALYEITGDTRYRDAFLSHWRSIRRCDRHNTGGFSTGEQACGDPYEPGAIETCCTIAWSAITLDALRLTGDPECADELELTLENAILGAQHPSGRWWTYSTPMDGPREASAHAIVFQARAGTPELNCCSVNGPRGLGMLSEWAVMRSRDGLTVNDLRPMKAIVSLPDGTPVTLTTTSRYPFDGDIALEVGVEKPAMFALAVRIPGFVHEATLSVPGEPVHKLHHPGYATARREWRPGDVVHLRFDLPMRLEAGDRAAAGRASLYRGPILLAYEPRFATGDGDHLPTIDPAVLSTAEVEFPGQDPASALSGDFPPRVLVKVPTADGRGLTLCDYASAGASGTPVRSWLPAKNLPPPPPLPTAPDDGAAIGPGAFAVAWRPSPLAEATTYQFLLAATDALTQPILKIEQMGGHRLIVSDSQAAALRDGTTYFWTLTAVNTHGSAPALGPPRRLRVKSK
jgi:hypothetical protein